MSAEFPGANGAEPGTYLNVVTQSRGVSVPGGTRLVAIVGEGVRQEVLVSSAIGAGSDGLNSSFTSTTGSDGRHFKLTFAPVVSNRTVLYKNGIPLVGLETESTGSFSSLYDYALDITGGHITLQSASLVDQGGAFYTASALNVGNGTINGLSLVDANASTETWTVKCTTVRRDTLGNPIDGYAKFVAQGSVSGILLDGYGNQVFWTDNNVITSNGVLSFAINFGATAFVEGDKFIVQVKSGTLVAGDSLVANYIGVGDINVPEFFTDIKSLTAKHGAPSLTNRISLGAQLAFANSPPGVWTCESAPAIPRRNSYVVETSASGGVTLTDLEFPLPLNVIPDVNSQIHFFVTNPVTGIESQVLPNKVGFYDPLYTGSPSNFCLGSFPFFSYTVVLENAVDKRAQDGVIVSTGAHTATLDSTLVNFNTSDVGKKLQILSPDVNAALNITITSVANGIASLTAASGSFTNSTGATFEVIDITASSATILLTKDLVLTAGASLRVTVVDQKDASFFDAGWEAAYQALEAIDIDIVVPLPSQTISTIFQNGRIHCENMSNTQNRLERVLFIGAINGLTPNNITGVSLAAIEDLGVLEGIQGASVSDILAGKTEDLANYSVAAAYGGSFRVVYFYPDQIVVSIGGSNTIVDGFFIAPAAAGFLSGVLNIAIPLTNKVISGFTILSNRLFRPIVRQGIEAAGVTLLQPVQGGGLIKWGKTTTQSGFPEEEEISVVFIRDRIAKSMRGAFNGFIGTAGSPTLQGSLMTRANSALQSFISSGLITKFQDLKVIQDAVEPRQWNITVAVQPVYPVNWIYIEVDIGLL